MTDLYSREREPDRLFHYTSTANFLSIIKSKELWATEIRYLNDTQEMSFFTRRLAQHVQDLKLQDPREQEIQDQLQNWLDHHEFGGGLIFLVSLSAKGNLLSQWRSYTRVGQGVSIGLHAPSLRLIGTSQGFMLGKCIYDPAEANSMAAKLATFLIAHAKNVGPTGPSYQNAFGELEELMLRIGALYKHEAFSEEAEWRLVSKDSHGLFAGPGIHHRPGLNSIVPYKPFCLKTEPVIKDESIIPEIVVGPCPSPNKSTAAVMQVMSRSDFKHGSRLVRPSSIPLQNV